MDELLLLIIGAVIALLGVGGIAAIRKRGSSPAPGLSKKEYEEKVKERKNELKEEPAADIVDSLDNSDDVESVKEQSGLRIYDRFGKILNRARRKRDLDRR